MPSQPPHTNIETPHLSPHTLALLRAIETVPRKKNADDFSKVTVSQTVSFFALLYERMRNTLEYTEDRLLLRGSLERIIRRRLSMNPQGKGEGENIVRELMWARYVSNGSLDEQDIQETQRILNSYLVFLSQVTKVYGRSSYIVDSVIQMLTCEVSEALRWHDAQVESYCSYYIYQIFHDTIAIAKTTQEQKDAWIFLAIEQAYRTSDQAYKRYHLYTLLGDPISQQKKEALKKSVHSYKKTLRRIDAMIQNPYREKLYRFMKKQLPPFYVLFTIIQTEKENAAAVLRNPHVLWQKVQTVCSRAYATSHQRVSRFLGKAFVSFILVRGLLFLLLEWPLAYLLYGRIQVLYLIMSTLFFIFWMVAIAYLRVPPGKENTKRIYQRILYFVTKHRSQQQGILLSLSSQQQRGEIFSFFFSVLSIIVFGVMVYAIHLGLSFLQVTLLNQIFFLCYISIVTFLGYSIRQVVDEYRVVRRDSVLGPVVYLFFVPVLTIGKRIAGELYKLRAFIVLVDFFVEAPFKLLIEVFDEWSRYLKRRKDELL